MKRIALKIKHICAVFLLLVTSAETLTCYHPKAGIAFHATILFALLFYSARETKTETEKNLSQFLVVLLLAPLIRILSLSMPFAQVSKIFGFLFISIPIFLATFTGMLVQGLRLKDLGFSLPKLKHVPINAGVVLFAVPAGIIEFQILKPAPLPAGEGAGLAANFVVAAAVFVVCTGFLEELVFRGLIQHNARKLMSRRWGIFFVSILFGVLHIGNLAVLDCFLAFSVGFLYSVIREQTGSIFGISLSHGIINVILFLVAPYYF